MPSSKYAKNIDIVANCPYNYITYLIISILKSDFAFYGSIVVALLSVAAIVVVGIVSYIFSMGVFSEMPNIARLRLALQITVLASAFLFLVGLFGARFNRMGDKGLRSNIIGTATPATPGPATPTAASSSSTPK